MIVPYVEPLLYCFVARRAGRFSARERERFLASFETSCRTIHKYYGSNDHHQSFLKYWLNWYLAKIFGNYEMPVRDEWVQDALFHGWCRLFVARSVARKDLSFIYSLAKGSKQAWPRVSDETVERSLKKHADRLSALRPILHEDDRECLENLSEELFAECSGWGTKFLPTGSACLQATRREGGALGKLSIKLKAPTCFEQSAVGKLPALIWSLDCHRQEEFSRFWKRAEASLYKRDPTGTFMGNRVKIQKVFEPGKIRIISEGDGYVYSALQPLQGLLLDAWKRHPASSMRTQDLTDRVNILQTNTPFATHWYSVDYEAATDLLKRKASAAALWGVRHSPYYRMAIDSLTTPGIAEYPDGSEVLISEGQLMGHPLSFPLLCLINLAAYYRAIDEYVAAKQAELIDIYPWWGHFRQIMRENVLVNGDDMLFRGPEDFRPFFLRSCGNFGFLPSAGKNYISTDMAMINSQVFQRKGDRMVRQGYLNFRFLYGGNVKTGDSECTPTQIGRELNRMYDLAPWTAATMSVTFKRWFHDCDERFQANWFLPVHLGGYGVDIKWAPATFRITRAQRRLAAAFVANPGLQLYRKDGGLSSKEVKAILSVVPPNRMVELGPRVIEEGEALDDPWTGRVTSGVRWICGPSDNESARVAYQRLGLDFRLKPMGITGFERWWRVESVGPRLPPCPPPCFLYLGKEPSTFIKGPIDSGMGSFA